MALGYPASQQMLLINNTDQKHKEQLLTRVAQTTQARGRALSSMLTHS
jgi:hypothetical protein